MITHKAEFLGAAAGPVRIRQGRSLDETKDVMQMTLILFAQRGSA